MVRSTSALLDTSAARSLLDRPTARAVPSRFSADSWSDDPDAADEDAGVAPEVPKLGSFEVMYRTIDIAQSALAAYPPDLLIEVPRSTCRSLEFHRAVEVIAAGRELANHALDALEGAEDETIRPAIEG